MGLNEFAFLLSAAVSVITRTHTHVAEHKTHSTQGGHLGEAVNTNTHKNESQEHKTTHTHTTRPRGSTIAYTHHIKMKSGEKRKKNTKIISFGYNTLEGCSLCPLDSMFRSSWEKNLPLPHPTPRHR